MGDTPWQEAARTAFPKPFAEGFSERCTALRTVVGMMDLPESAWAAALELHTAEAWRCSVTAGVRLVIWL